MKLSKKSMFSPRLLLAASFFLLPHAWAAERPYMAGYMAINAEHPPLNYNAGYTVYVAAWPMLSKYPGHQMQTGLFGTWMFGKQKGDALKDMYSTIEGGVGWWRNTHFPTITPKFLMGGVAPNFKGIANGPSQGGGTWAEPKGQYGVAQLSPWLLFPLDGLNLKQGTRGELFGYGYLPLPFTAAKTMTAGKNIPTGDQSWTLFLNTKNFKGPVCFFTPYFWSHEALDHPEYAGLMLDTQPSDPIKSIALECQYIPAALETNAKGEAYARIAPVSFPMNSGNQSIVMHRMTCYTRLALWDGVKTWFEGGKPCPGTFNPKGAFVLNFQANEGSSWGIKPEDQVEDKRLDIDWNSFAKASVADRTSYAFKWSGTQIKRFNTSKGGAVTIPEYYHRVKNEGSDQWVVTTAKKVPEGLKKANFDCPKEEPQQVCDTPDAADSSFKSPGPVAGPFKAMLGDNSEVTYYWYRFADQPAMLNADLTASEREDLQKKVEKLHRSWTKDLEYLAPPTVGDLAALDPALIVRPPKGFEIGYVPIATRQELAVKKDLSKK